MRVFRGIYRFLSLYGRLVAVGFAFYFIYIFLVAFVSPEKAVLITINDYGEAVPELGIVIVCGACMVVAVAEQARVWRAKWRNRVRK